MDTVSWQYLTVKVPGYTSTLYIFVETKIVIVPDEIHEMRAV